MKRVGLILSVIFCGGLLMFVPAKHYQRAIADKILRFHVIANSNSAQDQALKLKVRDCVIEYLSGPLKACETKEESETVICSLLPQIKEKASELVRRMGYDYTIEADVGEEYFPVKTYGEMTFPRGYYESLTIRIGSGAGRNWWCVLFPNLCFTDAVTAQMPEESEQLLSEQLDAQAYGSLYEGERLQLRFKLAEWLRELF